MKSDTIIAQSTPSGPGAIAILRLSGEAAFSIVDQIAHLPKNKRLSDLPTHTIHFGYVTSPEGEHLDQVLFFIMRGPHTFTGEDVVEISCHNNQFIIESIIQSAITKGARSATHGEFTRRAFEHGKINLVQAEAINELICAQTEAALKKSLAQLEGSFSHWIATIEQSLVSALALCEASFEFLEEEHDFSGALITRIEDILRMITQVQKTFDIKTQIRQGIRIALIGSVNAGKSSLFNRLLNQERSIVTNIAGTTRDTIEAGMYHQGNHWTLIDTAGIRTTDDVIEQEGIRRSLDEAHRADIILLVVDGSVPLEQELHDTYKKINAQHQHKIIPVHTKSDLPQKQHALFQNTITIASTTGNNCEKLEQQIETAIKQLLAQANAPFLINQRHYTILSSIQQKLTATLAMLTNEIIHYELVAYHLKDIIEELSNLTGKTVTAAMLDRVFSDFCIGK